MHEKEALARENRIWVRYSAPRETYCQMGSGNVDQWWWLAKIKDISLDGIGLFLGRQFEPGTILTVELEGRRDAEVRSKQAKVMHATRQEGEWLHGCKFLEPLTEEILQKLL